MLTPQSAQPSYDVPESRMEDGRLTADRCGNGVALLPSDDTGLRIRFTASQDEKAGKNRMHVFWDQDQETAIRSPHGGPKITWGGPPLMPNAGKNRLHFDLAPPVHGDQQAEVARLMSLAASRVDVDQGDVDWVVLADPDDNELCVFTTGGETASVAAIPPLAR